jgi:hypothetical protein
MPTIPLLPCGGIDNVHAASHAVFQPRQVNGQPAPPERVQSVVDLDIDSDGAVSTRPGVATVHPTEVPVGLWGVGGREFWQSAGTLYEGTTIRVTGLCRRVVLQEHGGSIFGTDGSKHFVLTGDTVATWGLPVPEITVRAVSGMLTAGRYLVQASFADMAGNEGGLCDFAAIDLIDGQSIEIDVIVSSPLVVAVNLYVGAAEQARVAFQRQVGVSGFPCTLAELSLAADPPRTHQMQGPWEGLVGIASFRAFILVWRDQVVVRSEATEPHLFHPDNIMQFPNEVLGVFPLTSGVWVSTSGGLWWVAGEDPGSFIPSRKTTTPMLRGGGLAQGRFFPSLQTTDLVALMASREGLVAGRSDGTAVPMTYNRYHFAQGDEVSLAVAESAVGYQLFAVVS